MKYTFVIIFAFILTPSIILAACDVTGYTVVYVNGIFTTKKQANLDVSKLQDYLGYDFNSENLVVRTGYNESHLGGAGDLMASISQLLGSSINNYDRDTILLQIHPEVTTRKILLVGHSQGTFYTNEIYNYLIGHGVLKEAVGVYNVATPASSVAGGGTYLTSENDKVINAVRGVASRIGAKQPLPANISIPLTSEEVANSFGGHSFSGVYLANDSARIVSNAESTLKKLVATEALDADSDGCFTPPARGMTYYAQKSVFAVADTAAGGVVLANGTISAVGETAYNGSLATVLALGTGVKNTLAVIQSAGEKSVNAVAQVLNLMGGTAPSAIETVNGKFKSASVIDSLGGLFSSATGDNLKLAATVDLSAANSKTAVNKTASDEIINSVAVTEGINIQDFNNDTQNEDINVAQVKNMEIIDSPNITNLVIQKKPAQVCKFATDKTASRQKLLINEVAWMGTQNSANDEWIELKNISGSLLDISGWQILDKEEQIKITFENLKIENNAYLLLERTDDNSVPAIKSDAVYAGALANANDGLRLFDGECNLIDEVLADTNWPAGLSEARRTMERQSDLSWNTYSGNGETIGGLLILGTPKKENSPVVVFQSGGVSVPASSVVIPVVSEPTVELSNILISEIQITGGTGQSDNEFIELYNPNNLAIDLSALPLKLHIRNSNGTDSHKTLTFINTTIPAKGYFLIGPSSGYTESVTLDATYSASSGNKLVNNGGVYISKSGTAGADVLDKVGWGTQLAGGYEADLFSENPIANQSISRKLEADTDNNANDFIKSKPTPKNSLSGGGFLNPDVWAVLEQLVNHIVISEIYPDRTGANQDFVELYNPNATSTGDLDISGWSLQVLSAGATTTDKITKKNFVGGNKISGRGFFLVGVDIYSSGDMNWPSGSLNSTNGATIFLVNGTTTISGISDSRIVDRIAYGNGSAVDFAEAVPTAMPASGQSLERKAFQSDYCVSSQNEGEFSGNGCDTDDNSADFELRNVPNPQTAQKLPEPRTAPSLPGNFSAVYATSSAKMLLSWDASQDYKSATSTLSYSISYATSTSSGQATSTSVLKNLTTVSATTTYLFKINDVGTNYEFSISAKDGEGLSSDSATVSISVSSPLTDFYFYKDSRATTSKKYLFDFYYGDYPFIPNSYNSNTGRIMVFYLNKEVPGEIELNSSNHFRPENSDGTVKDGIVEIVYTKCSGDSPSSAGSPAFSLILPGPCGTAGGAENSTLTSGSLEDSHLLFALVKTTDDIIFTDQDFVTVGMYSYYDYNGGWETYKPAVLDRTKYFFKNQPPDHSLPELGGEITVYFDKSTSKLETEWPKAVDSDTLDIFLTYEISYDGGANWQSTSALNKADKVVVPGDSFSILVRAKDDFGNYSDPSLAVFWSYPATVFHISQIQLNSWSASFGTKNQNCPSCAGTASLQSIRPQENFEFNTVTLRLKQEIVSDTSRLGLAVYPDLNGLPDFSALISEAQLTDMLRPDPDSDIAFTFDNPVVLSAGEKYWLVLSVKEYGDSRGYERNQWQNAINTGSDLYGYGRAGRGNSGTCNGYCDFTVPYPDATADWYLKIGLSE